MKGLKTEIVEVSKLEVGDAILSGGVLHTVCSNQGASVVYAKMLDPLMPFTVPLEPIKINSTHAIRIGNAINKGSIIAAGVSLFLLLIGLVGIAMFFVK